MNYLSKKVLYINLEDRTFDVKSFPELHQFIGGLPLALKLGDMFVEQKPLIFAIGPLNGFFPYVSGTCVLNLAKTVESFYLGGSLSSRIRFSGFDAVILEGQSEKPVFLEIDSQGVTFLDSKEAFDNAGLPGRSSKILFSERALLDDYFESPEGILEKAFAKRLIGGLVVNATVSYPIKNNLPYEKLYHELLQRGLSIHKFAETGNFPSCIGCPLGCANSKIGEVEGNALVHTMVACEHMADLYSDVGIVFSCLNVLGYDYKHEDLERIPFVVEELTKSINKKI